MSQVPKPTMPPYAFSTLNDIPPQVFTMTSLYSIAFMGVLSVAAYYWAVTYAPKHATRMDRYTRIWFVRPQTTSHVASINSDGSGADL